MPIPHALLALLAEGPKSGNQLRHQFQNSTGHTWTLNPGQVYATLRRLTRQGWIGRDDTALAGQPRSLHITPPGQKELAAWLRTPPNLSTPPRDELVLKALIASNVRSADALNVIHTHREHLIRRQQAWEKIVDHRTRLATVLAAEAEAYRIGALIHWLDTAEQAIRQTADQPKEPAAEDPDDFQPRPAARASSGR